ncbi:MAG: SRPBCC family protein [Desulfobacterales bacterium]|jgi:hypothetical protein|nr:SRPBCC family protein [Desulfobacterales bacterium]
MIIAASIKINAPLSTVWDVFTDIRNWKEWNPVCRECRLEEGDAMACGACFSFELNPMILSIRIKAVIDQFEPGKQVVWSGSRLGIDATHTFTFIENDGHVLLKSEESFSGPLLFLARLIGIPSRLHQLSNRLLESIKQQAESRR